MHSLCCSDHYIDSETRPLIFRNLPHGSPPGPGEKKSIGSSTESQGIQGRKSSISVDVKCIDARGECVAPSHFSSLMRAKDSYETGLGFRVWGLGFRV